MKKKNKTWSELTPKERKRGIINLSVLAVVLAFIIWIFSLGGDSNYDDYKDLSRQIPSMASVLIEKQLKYPDGWEYEAKKVTRLDNTTYRLDAVILAKNGFGVRSRINYQFKARWKGSKETSHQGFIEVTKPSNWDILKSDLHN
jgi:hypothetical protein